MEIVHFLRRQAFGIAILACAAVAFAFPSAFIEWGGVKLMKLVVPAIQIIMFGMGTTLSTADFLRVAKRPWAVATGVFLQFLVMPLVGFLLAKGSWRRGSGSPASSRPAACWSAPWPAARRRT